MRDFLFDRVRLQEAEPEPYTVYRPEQAVQENEKVNATLRDFEYFRSMYPDRVKKLQRFVEAACDKLDYNGSPMYDEYPDRLMVEELCRQVEEQAQKELEAEELRAEETRLEETRQNEAQTEEIRRKDSDAENLAAEEVEADDGLAAEEAGKAVTPRTSFGPECVIQSAIAESGNYKIWELTEAPPSPEEEEKSLEESEKIQELNSERRPGGPWGPPPPPRPWGPPPPPPRPWGPPPPPPRPWGPPPPPPRPWGPPPPPPRPWGPPSPPPRPWGPPPPPPRPWGPPPPPRPGNRFDLDDIISLLLFGEMQNRRCRNGRCR